MQKMIKQYFVLSLLLANSIVQSALAQEPQRFTEDQVAAQKEYIEADAALLLGNHEEAITLYQKLYQGDRTNAAITYNLARAYAATEDFESANKYIDLSLRNGSDNKWYRVFKANLMRDLGRHAEASEHYGILHQSEPTNRYFAENYAYELLRMDSVDQSIAVLEDWQKNQGVSEEITKKLFEIYDSQGNVVSAIGVLTELAEAYPNELRYSINLVNFLIRNGENDLAKIWLDRILTDDPNHAEAIVLLSKLDDGNPNKKTGTAAENIVKLIKANDVDLDNKIKAMIPLLEGLSMGQQLVDSSTLVELKNTLLTKYPNDAKVLSIAGDLSHLEYDYSASIAYYQKALSSDDRVYTVWENYLYGLWRLSNYDEVVKVGYDAIDLFPNQYTAYHYYVLGLLGQGKMSEAEDMLFETQMIAGGNPALLAQVEMLKAYVAKSDGRYEQGIKILEGVKLAVVMQSPMYLELVGDLYYKSGKTKEALQFWQRAENLLPDAVLKAKVQNKSL